MFYNKLIGIRKPSSYWKPLDNKRLNSNEILFKVTFLQSEATRHHLLFLKSIYIIEFFQIVEKCV
jgi:hypothetical protein